MSIAVPSRVRRRTGRLFAIIITALLAAVIHPAVPAHADAPNPPVDAPFSAPLCEGATDSNPTNATGPVPDLSLVFGQRLVSYNAGEVVPLYTTWGTNTNNQVPLCAVRHVEGVGAVSEWIYCTDVYSATCAFTNEDGALEYNGQVVPGNERLEGNSRLTTDQERVIAYIVRNDITLASGSVASNDTSWTRWDRQKLVWCVSDPGYDDAFCAPNMGEDEQARILALVPAEVELTLELDADSTDLEVGDTARVDVTTNVYNQPIALTVSGGQAEVCAGDDATFEGGELVVAGDDAGETTTVSLCITSDTAGEVTVEGETAPVTREQITWSQSPGVGRTVCQVYATFDTTTDAAVRSAAVVSFSARTLEGGFSLQKAVEGTGADLVDADVLFTVEYRIDGGAAEQVTLSADGTPELVDGLEAGLTVTLEEIDLPEVEGIEWGTPVFTVDGVETTSFEVVGDETVEIVLTNDAILLLGGFSLQKLVEGTGAHLVGDDAVFTVEYTVDGAAAERVTLSADGTAEFVEGLEPGVTITLAEIDLPEVHGVEWGTPVFTVDGVETTSFEVVGDETVEIVLTNDAVIVEEVMGTDDGGKTIGTDEQLSETGADIPWLLGGAAAAAVLAGIVLLLIRRRATV